MNENENEHAFAPLPQPILSIDDSPTVISEDSAIIPEDITAPKPQKKTLRFGGRKISRRTLLIGASVVGLAAAGIAGGTLLAREQSVFAPGANVTPAVEANIAHLLRRAGFGGTQSDIQYYGSLGLTAAINQLLNYETITDPIENQLNSMNFDFTKFADMQRWWILRMLYTKRPLQEKMTLFWHGLLTSSAQKIGGPKNLPLLIQQNQFLRAHALDTFDNILLGITQDPAMMWWLDLRLSRKNNPNENYARELLELFTLGVSSGYTQDDVRAAAFALTGWSLRNGASVYTPAQHNTATQTFLGQTGSFDYRDIIRIIAAHPAAGPHLATRLFSFFVHPNPSAEEIKPMVDAYYSSGHSVKAVMQAMFNAPAFFSAAAYRARIKSPPEFVIGSIRQLELKTQGQGVGGAMAAMGQSLFAPVNVAGWPGDTESEAWMNTATWLARINLLNTAANVPGFLAAETGNILAFETMTSDIAKHNLKSYGDFINYYAQNFIDSALSSERLALLTQFLQINPYPSALQNITFADGTKTSWETARNTIYILLSGPEYQLN